MPTIDILLPGYSFGTDSGTPAFCAVILVESEGRRILVDTAHVGRRVQLQEQLAKRGLAASDIDLILMTHAHWDHVQNFDAFPDVPMAIHAHERKYASEPHVNDWATPTTGPPPSGPAPPSKPTPCRRWTTATNWRRASR